MREGAREDRRRPEEAQPPSSKSGNRPPHRAMLQRGARSFRSRLDRGPAGAVAQAQGKSRFQFLYCLRALDWLDEQFGLSRSRHQGLGQRAALALIRGLSRTGATRNTPKRSTVTPAQRPTGTARSLKSNLLKKLFISETEPPACEAFISYLSAGCPMRHAAADAGYIPEKPGT